MPKIVDFEQKKLEIADRSIAVFADKGYYNTKLSDIAKACSMGRTTLYQYFKNKDEIYLYILELGMSFFLLRFEELKKDSSLSNIDKLKELTSYLLVNIEGQRVAKGFVDFWLMVRHNNYNVEEKLFKLSQSLENAFKEILDSAINSGEIINIDTASMSTLIIGALESLTIQDIVYGDIHYEKLYKSMIILIDGLKSLEKEELL